MHGGAGSASDEGPGVGIDDTPRRPGVSHLVFRKPACQADFRGLNYANLHYGIEGCNVEPRAQHNAPVAQRIEHLTTDQKVGGSNPSGRADGNPAFVAGFRRLEEALSGSRQKYPRLNSYLR